MDMKSLEVVSAGSLQQLTDKLKEKDGFSIVYVGCHGIHVNALIAKKSNDQSENVFVEKTFDDDKPKRKSKVKEENESSLV